MAGCGLAGCGLAGFCRRCPGDDAGSWGFGAPGCALRSRLASMPATQSSFIAHRRDSPPSTCVAALDARCTTRCAHQAATAWRAGVRYFNQLGYQPAEAQPAPRSTRPLYRQQRSNSTTVSSHQGVPIGRMADSGRRREQHGRALFKALPCHDEAGLPSDARSHGLTGSTTMLVVSAAMPLLAPVRQSPARNGASPVAWQPCPCRAGSSSRLPARDAVPGLATRDRWQ